MEINVGEYVRDKNGLIKRVNSYNPQENNPLWETLNGNVQMKGTIIKHSKDILDIIEVGDYVNGYLIKDIYGKGEGFDEITLSPEMDECSYTTIKNEDIKEVLTKEQFEANAYTIEKEV